MTRHAAPASRMEELEGEKRGLEPRRVRLEPQAIDREMLASIVDNLEHERPGSSLKPAPRFFDYFFGTPSPSVTLSIGMQY